MSTKQIILTLKYTGLLLFTIIRIVWFSPWEKIADDGENLRLKKLFEKKNNVLMLCFCHQMRSVLAIQFHARTLLPARYWFKFIHKRFCIQGQKNTMNSSYANTHRNVFRYNTIAYNCIISNPQSNIASAKIAIN